MAYKTWSVGDVLTAADMNTYVRDQGITICTSGTRPTGIATGKVIFETDTNRLYAYDGSSWRAIGDSTNSATSYTPTTTNVSGGTTIGRYKLISEGLLWVSVGFSAGTATAAAAVTLSLPSGVTSASFGAQALSAFNTPSGSVARPIPAKVNASASVITLEGKDASGTQWVAADSLVNVRVTGTIALT
jgi:hypothetical protein